MLSARIDSTPPAAVDANAAPPLILVVDDQSTNIRALYEILKDRYEVCMARSGAEALDFCSRRSPDLILLDVVMPEMSGHELCRRLKTQATTRDIPVIFVTANDQPTDEVEGLNAGAVDFIAKPIHAAVVLARVRTHLMLKEQADRLRLLNDRMAVAAQAIGLGVWELDLTTNRLVLDDRIYELYGTTREGVDDAGQEFMERVHPEDRERVLSTHVDAIKRRQSYDIDFRIVRRNGEERVLRTAAVVGEGAQGGGLRMTAMNWDITELKKAERMKSEFVSVVSHELRTPLTSIRGALGLLAGGVDASGAKMTRLLQMAVRNADRLGVLIDDLLEMEKLEIGQQKFSVGPHSITKLALQSIEANAGYAIKRQIQFRLIGQSREAFAMVDPSRLLQVMANLMSNAAKASPRGATVDIEIAEARWSDGAAVRVSVRDYGVGVPEEFRGKIFEKFKQAEQVDRAHSGTGLGLAICKAIVERLGGRIGFHSETNQGATFYFELPAVTASEAVA